MHCRNANAIAIQQEVNKYRKSAPRYHFGVQTIALSACKLALSTIMHQCVRVARS